MLGGPCTSVGRGGEPCGLGGRQEGEVEALTPPPGARCGPSRCAPGNDWVVEGMWTVRCTLRPWRERDDWNDVRGCWFGLPSWKT
eukprot:1188256-Prorocentrum_minimum.AAC.5